MRLTIIGCSGSFPGPESPASSYLVEATGPGPDGSPRTWRVLLDLGSGALGALQRYADPLSLDAVVISHLHPDHFMDLCGLYVARRYAPSLNRPAPALPVYGPAGTFDRVLQAYGPDAAGELENVYDVRELADGGTFRVGPFTITPRLVRHPVTAFALRVEARSGDRTAVLAYSGDTDACAGLTEVARDADVFLCEASFTEGRDDDAHGIHLTGRRAGQTATEAGVGRLVLTHLPVWTDPGVARGEAVETYAGPIEVAHSGLQLDVGVPVTAPKKARKPVRA
ncbi:MBL fold metallo-hydrolase [Spongisporangium articulatum]|uniref:MBL fold metallo-hydrolase n=1 Tax=Spongisporangium articulatum TaxID=3362603 RepID=A0ABW8AKV5_9ACTN